MRKRWGEIQGGIYRHILKPVLFQFDPEHVHDAFTWIGRIIGSSVILRRFLKDVYTYEDAFLHQTICGISFPNPIGLSAGFDKNGLLIEVMPCLGFGFEEVGSVTGEPCEGNPRPRLWRLPRSRGLVVHYGLKNDGCLRVAPRFRSRKTLSPVGVSIAKTNAPTTVSQEEGIRDYVKAFSVLHADADYVTVNISCPNAFGGEPFTDPQRLDSLLAALDAISTKKPIFIKVPVDDSKEELQALLDVALRHRVQGVVIANLTKRRDRKEIDGRDGAVVQKGGISGKPTFDASNQLIAHAFRYAGDRLVIIGSGGVFTAEDAYKKIRCGAALVELITGMIFEGPQQIGFINEGIAKLLRRDGFTHVSQAIGADAVDVLEKKR